MPGSSKFPEKPEIRPGFIEVGVGLDEYKCDEETGNDGKAELDERKKLLG